MDILISLTLYFSFKIGHFICHRDKIGDGLVDDALYRQTTYNGIINNDINAKDEQQANNFAANLLMPATLIENIKTLIICYLNDSKRPQKTRKWNRPTR